MTDRVNALIVVLQQDTRTDDVESLENAIRMMRNVQSVQRNVADLESHVAFSRARHELIRKLFVALGPDTARKSE